MSIPDALLKYPRQAFRQAYAKLLNTSNLGIQDSMLLLFARVPVMLVTCVAIFGSRPFADSTVKEPNGRTVTIGEGNKIAATVTRTRTAIVPIFKGCCGHSPSKGVA